MGQKGLRDANDIRKNEDCEIRPGIAQPPVEENKLAVSENKIPTAYNQETEFVILFPEFDELLHISFSIM